jgi:hypothetical protein
MDNSYFIWRGLRVVYYQILKAVTSFVNDILKSKTFIMFQIRNLDDVFTDFRLLPNNLMWMELIRIGSLADGGYFLPNILSKDMICFSPGYGGKKEFEDDLSERGITSYICDLSYDEIPNLRANQFYSKFELVDEEVDNNNQKTLNQWIADTKIKSDAQLILQMDIEGAEYKILQKIDINLLRKFTIVLIEFHRLDLLFISNDFSRMFNEVLTKLFSEYILVHLEVNNEGEFIKHSFKKFPKVVELTFVKKDVYQNWNSHNVNTEVIYRSVNNPDMPYVAYPF